MARQFYKETTGNTPATAFETSAPAGFALITDRDENIELYVGKYMDREEDGKLLFNETRAAVYYDFTQGEYGDPTLPATAQKIFDLEDFLEGVSVRLKSGDWMSAQSITDSLVVDTVELFTQAFKDNLKSEIDTYINDNY